LLLQIGEKWMVMHEYNSVSFAVESGEGVAGFQALVVGGPAGSRCR
jgi:hypothetical protein